MLTRCRGNFIMKLRSWTEGLALTGEHNDGLQNSNMILSIKTKTAERLCGSHNFLTLGKEQR